MKNRSGRCLAAFLMVSIVGCGTAQLKPQSVDSVQQNKNNAVHRIPAGAKVGLAIARLDHTTPIDPARRSNYQNNRPSATAEALKATPEIVFECSAKSLFLLTPVCLFSWPIMMLTFGLTADAASSVKNAAVNYGNNLEEERLKAEKLNLKQRRKAFEELDESLTGFPSILERSSSYANKVGMHDLFIALDDYRSSLDFVYEIAPPELEYFKDSSGQGSQSGAINSSVYRFRISTRVKLLRPKTNVVVEEFLISAVTDDTTVDASNPESAKLVAIALDSALDRMAKQLVENWIKPHLGRGERNSELSKGDEAVIPAIAPTAVVEGTSPTRPSPEECTVSPFPRETSRRIAEQVDILENRCRD